MSKLKWKSTSECIQDVRFGLGYKSGYTPYNLKVEKEAAREHWESCWYWTIISFDFSVRSKSYCYYEDEAANAAYQFAWKYLRKKRPVKRAKKEAEK